MGRPPLIPSRKLQNANKRQPVHVAKLFQQGLELHRQGKLQEAKAVCEQILAQQSEHFDALYLSGVIACQMGQIAHGLEWFDKAIQINPNVAQVYLNRGLALKSLGRLEEAVASYSKAIALKSDYVDALQNRAGIFWLLQRFSEAIESYEQLIAVQPKHAEAFNNRGAAFQSLNRFDEALASYDRAIALRPDYAEAYYNRGVLLQSLKRLDEALASCDRAIALRPDYAEAYYNRGVLLQSLKRSDEALESYDKALAIKLDYAEALNNRGVLLQSLKRSDEALASYDQALAIKPDYAEALSNRGNALLSLYRLDEALVSYDQAIAVAPDYAEALNNRGNALLRPKRFEEALASFDKALAIKPDYEFLSGLRLYTQIKLCDWNHFSGHLHDLEAAIEVGRKATHPFPMVGLLDNPALQLKANQIYVKDKYPEDLSLGALGQRLAGAKIKIGYYSADFHNHATSHLMAQLFESHDRQRFEVYGFSFGPNLQDDMRRRVLRAFEQFIDVSMKSDREVAQMSRAYGLDIAVDLKGFTQDSRMGMFAYRCAPIQVNYLGYPGTMGAPYIDYIVADETLIPQTHQRYYSEKVVYMPQSYQVNDATRKISDRVFTRQELGLPAQDFVFCCFNNNWKILPAIFDVWMRLLGEVPGSVLWLLEDNATAAKNLRREAQARGVDPVRLVFAQRMELSEHLARQRVADLFLDTVPCNAHTTASDALWAGLPVLTLLGESFAARVAGSLLHALEMPELITRDVQAYEAKARELATRPELLGEVKVKLARKRLSSALFDGELFTRHLERAYLAMHERYKAGQAPEHIHVAA